MRQDGRKNDEMRPVGITQGFLKYAEGSALIEVGDTRVICSATIEEGVPPFLRGKGIGWVTAEYAMLPRSAQARIARESAKGKIGGRTHEIQRLVGRSLRSIIDMKQLGERTIWIDCDVIQADGGTRTASITGAFIALVNAVRWAKANGTITSSPIKDYLAAVSVGIVKGTPVLDLCYVEDSAAEVDMNFVMTGDGRFVEVQGTAESKPFSHDEMLALTSLAEKGVRELVELQKNVLGGGI